MGDSDFDVKNIIVIYVRNTLLVFFCELVLNLLIWTLLVAALIIKLNSFIFNWNVILTFN